MRDVAILNVDGDVILVCPSDLLEEYEDDDLIDFEIEHASFSDDREELFQVVTYGKN